MYKEMQCGFVYNNKKIEIIKIINYRENVK